jgi:tetratricopeptide (TPR) repeat protein
MGFFFFFFFFFFFLSFFFCEKIESTPSTQNEKQLNHPPPEIQNTSKHLQKKIKPSNHTINTVAKHSLDKETEGKAHGELARCYEAMDDLPTAIEHHERCLRLAKRARNAGAEAAAQHRLFAVYEQFAAKCEARRAWPDAVKYHSSCMGIAEGTRDDRLRGKVHMRLAGALKQMGDLTSAAEHAEAYLDLCVRVKDNDGACTACHFLAGTYKALGKTQNAVEFLERLLELSQQAEQRAVQSEACSELGTIYNVKREYGSALGYYEESFDLARTVGDQSKIATSRVQLGIAKGNASLDEFAAMVTNPNPLEFFSWRLERATK